MKSKKLSITVALSWFALIGVWYVFSAMNFYHQGSILDPFSRTDSIVSVCWLTIPPLFWWLSRRLLIRNGQWHRAGTIAFCICHALSFPCMLILGNQFSMLDGWSTVFFLLLNVEMFLAELLILLFKWDPARRKQ